MPVLPLAWSLVWEDQHSLCNPGCWELVSGAHYFITKPYQDSCRWNAVEESIFIETSIFRLLESTYHRRAYTINSCSLEDCVHCKTAINAGCNKTQTIPRNRDWTFNFEEQSVCSHISKIGIGLTIAVFCRKSASGLTIRESSMFGVCRDVYSGNSACQLSRAWRCALYRSEEGSFVESRRSFRISRRWLLRAAILIWINRLLRQ